jgi:sugar phosphate isomerase/epimerase
MPRGTSFLERLAAASAAGFDAISLWGRDHAAARASGLTDADMRAALADHGLSVNELDPAWSWAPGAVETAARIPPAYDEQQIFGFDDAALLDVAEAVGARSLNAVDVFGGPWGLDDAAEAFAGLCDRAAERGLLVHLEFLPWSNVPDIGAAWDVVRRSGRPNGGVSIDAWHLARSGGGPSSVASIPGDRILALQLCDAPREPETDLTHASLHERRLPGDGDLDLPGLVRALDEIGAAPPIGVEVFSDSLHALAPHDVARRAGAAVRAVLASA